MTCSECTRLFQAPTHWCWICGETIAQGTDVRGDPVSAHYALTPIEDEEEIVDDDGGNDDGDAGAAAAEDGQMQGPGPGRRRTRRTRTPLGAILLFVLDIFINYVRDLIHSSSSKQELVNRFEAFADDLRHDPIFDELV